MSQTKQTDHSNHEIEIRPSGPHCATCDCPLWAVRNQNTRRER